LGAVQTIPHEPQFAASVASFTHEPLHAVSPAAQLEAHTPAVQTWLLAQAFAHAPQWAALVWRLTSHPLAGCVSQSAYPVLHVPTLHCPDTQVGFAFGTAQGAPQLPQLSTLVAMSISQPSATLPLQSELPVVHEAIVHLLSLHEAAAFGMTQAFAHAPQFAGSLVSETQAPEQSVSSGPQEEPHTPALHTLPPGHAAAQLPQLPGSF
jgi:hypothetical protein